MYVSCFDYKICFFLYRSEEEIDFDDIDLNSLFRTYDVSVEMGHRTLWPVEDVRAPVDISENTAKRVLYVSLRKTLTFT